MTPINEWKMRPDGDSALTRVHPKGLLLLAVAAFVTLAVAATLVGVLPADVAARDTLLGLSSPAVLAVMHVVNWAGDWRLLGPGTVLLFVVFREARQRWWIWAGLMVAAPTLEWLLKQWIGRPRPEQVSFGFPSGHATAAAAFFGALVYLAGALPRPACRLLRTAALVAIVLVALARVMLRAHWPSDVAGGIALGLALASMAALLGAREPE